MYAHLSMAELAARWSEALIADLEPDEQLTAAARAAGSLLRAPASEADIAATEERIGRRLPASYREFLLVSDGAYGDDYGPTVVYDDEPEEAWPETDVVGAGFLPVKDLRWLRDAQPSHAQGLSACGIGGYAPVEVDAASPSDWSPLADGLIVATDKGPGTTMLIPFEGPAEWQLWNVHKESVRAFVSFRSFLKYELRLREPVTDLHEVHELIERARAGDHVSTMRLSRVANTDAVPLLAAVAGEAPMGVQPAIGLARIGTEEAMSAIQTLEPRSQYFALRALGSDRAADPFVAAGDFQFLANLGDPRAADIAAAFLVAKQGGDPLRTADAIRVLGQAGDPRHAGLLLALLHDPEYDVDAARALLGMQRPEGEQRLIEIAETPDHPSQQRAAFLLGKY